MDLSRLIKNNSIFNRITFWTATWITLVISYLITQKTNTLTEKWSLALYFIQLAIDINILFLSFYSYYTRERNETRFFYLLIFASIIPGIFANESYNILINIIGVKKISNNISDSWGYGYCSFLMLQVVAWVYLISKYHYKFKTANISALTTYPYLLATLIILISLSMSDIFFSNDFQQMSPRGFIDTMLEMIVFTLISINLSRTKNNAVIYLEIGFLLLIAFNLSHRLSYSSGHLFKVFDYLWLISLIVITFGLKLSSESRNEDIEFHDCRSIHVLTTSASTLFSSLLFISSFTIEFFLSSIQMESESNLDILSKNLSSTLIFSFTISFLIGKIIARSLSNQIEKIIKYIDSIKTNENELHLIKLSEKKFKVLEIEKLSTFILKSIYNLKIANRAKSYFLMNMSHDFRTPTSGIFNLSKSLYKKIDDPKIKMLQKLIVDSSGQLMDHLEGILDYSRLDSNKFSTSHDKLDIVEEIKKNIDFVSAKIEEKNLVIDVVFSHNSITYYGDKFIFNRIILNLITNAIKFTPSGKITIIATLDNSEFNKTIIIKVADTGIGIDKAFHEAIFEPFYQLKALEVTTYPGIGIGLSNISLMLEKIGGQISLESSIGKGSIFTVALPLN